MENVELKNKMIICEINSTNQKLDKIYDLNVKMYLCSIKEICHTPLQHLKSIEETQ